MSAEVSTALAALAGAAASRAVLVIAEGFRKAILEPVARRMFRTAAAAALDSLPALFELTDPLIPDFIATAESGVDLERRVREAWASATGEQLADDVFNAWRQRFDPIACSDR